MLKADLAGVPEAGAPQQLASLCLSVRLQHSGKTTISDEEIALREAALDAHRAKLLAKKAESRVIKRWVSFIA